MKVIEIFDSIDGEGVFAGELATFIRLAGCNLRCRYCDTKYSFDPQNAEDMSITTIVNKCRSIGNKHVTLTGGEPLIHEETKLLINSLCNNGYIVNIETNGSIDVMPYQLPNTIITADYKTISSGENKRMHLLNIIRLRSCDVLKIVCASADFYDVEKLLQECEIKAQVILSPIYGEIEPVELVEFMKKIRGKTSNRIKMQIQLHKIIWDADKRGV